MVDKKYDVIVIGSGVGGLSIGSLLALKKRILVLEKNKSLGGYCSDFKNGGFRFESAVQAVNGFREGDPVYKVLDKAGAFKGVSIIQPDYLYRTIFPEYDIRIPQKNINSYKELLFSLFPKEEKSVESLFSTMKSIYQEISRFHGEGMIKKSPYLLKYGKRSLEDLMGEFIKDAKLKAIISQYWIYRGLPPSKLAATIFSYIWYDYTANGSYFPGSGMGDIIKNMTSTIKNNKGDVLPQSEVSRIHVKDGKVTDVELKNGRRISADIFVSNVDALRTFEMIDDVNDMHNRAFVDNLKKNTISISGFKIYLGLSVDIRDAGVKDYEIFLNPSYDIEAMYKASLHNDFERMPYSITIYSNLTDRFCDKGSSVISIGALAGYDYWRKFSKTEYLKKKEEAADIILSRCEKALPGLCKKIKVKIVATPLTMERYTGNSNGAIYGWNKRSLLDEIKFMSSTTPLKNLFLSSQWTKIGGGVAGVLLSTNRLYKLLNK